MDYLSALIIIAVYPPLGTIAFYVLLQHFAKGVPWDARVKFLSKQDRQDGWVSLGDLS